MDAATTHDRTQRLFRFLQEFTLLKAKPQRTSDNDTLLWLHALPQEPEVRNVARVLPEAAGDEWVSVRKPKFTLAPILPDALKAWAVGPFDDSRKAPTVRPQVIVESQIIDDDLRPKTIQETLFFDEQPHLLTAWEGYQRTWNAWATDDRRVKSVQDVYSKLFKFHQDLQAFGETYELRLGLGYLAWRTPDGADVRRHLLTASANLHFDALAGILTVTAAGDGARTTLEQDMLEPNERPAPSVQEAIALALIEQGEDLWSAETIPGLLETWVNATGDRGAYYADLTPRDVTSDPVVHFAPALILRRRGERSLTAAYQDILRQLPALSGVPNLASFVEKFDAHSTSGDHTSGSGKSGDEVYFPLPANDAQLDIIRRLRRQQGVLVQGPPGTGKSHTIVNLVSHLLATNQRVLVTSHTARALKVLREKFPAELAALCVTHLRGEEGSRAMMEQSVHEVLQRATHRTPWSEREQLEALSRNLETLRQREDRSLDTLHDIRRAETDDLDLFGYRGSAQSIGQALRAEEDAFSWIADLGAPKVDAPLSTSDAQRMLALLRDVTSDEARDVRRALPPLERQVPPEDFIRFVRAEQHAQLEAPTREAARAHPHYPLLRGAPANVRDELTRALSALSAAIESERRRPLAWLPSAIDATLQGQGGVWHDVLTHGDDVLPRVQARAAWLDETTLSGLEGRDRAAVRHDAHTLLEHLKAGGGWGNFLVKPAAVKNRAYLRDDVKIAGRPASTPEALQDLLDHFALTAAFEKLESTWQSLGVTVTGTWPQRVTRLAEQHAALRDLAALTLLLQAARSAVRAVPGLPEPRWWHADDLAALERAVSAATAEEDAAARRRTLEDLLPALDALLTSADAHDVARALRNAIDARDVNAYGAAYTRLQHLHGRRAQLDERDALLDRLNAAAPALADELTPSASDDAWTTRLATFERAWQWMRADARLTELANPDTEVDVRADLAACRQDIRDTLRDLAALKAWSSTLDRLTQREQQALVRWQTAMRRLGKGTGKHAERHRQTAREALEDARTAIPAWIMPLHLVAETFRLTPGMFDVVIVDEASQAGPEALFLAFIAKKIIIVGDDKQIEPEGVGIQLERVDALVKQYLYDFPAPEILGDRKASLFGFGAYAYSPQIGLREHFRCMPEIIAFSSGLSYADQPLIALRQFGADRLAPLVARHVDGGYTLAKRGDKVNPAEARAIVDQFKACLADPRYAGKTFGVISLVGDSQAEEIATMLRAEVPEAELERRKVVCGNAYSFQGDERDVIFLSVVDSPTDGRRATKRSRDDALFQPRYNVAASRARDQLWVVHSVTLEDLHPDDLRASLIRHAGDPEVHAATPLEARRVLELREQAARPGRGRAAPPAPFDSWFEVDVYLDIAERGYRVLPQYELNGYRIDLVVEGRRGRLAVECDGDRWHGPDKYRDDLHRQQTLERAGMQFWRVRGSTYARDPASALDDLWRTLDARGVYPEGDARNFTPREEAVTLAEPIDMGGSTDAVSVIDTPNDPDTPVTPNEPIGATPDAFTLPAYTHWTARTLPDPRSLDSLDPVIDALRDILAVEGPMPCRLAYATYARAAGVNLGKTVQSLLNRAVAKAVRGGVFVQVDEWQRPGQIDKIVRLANTPPVRLRERGPRDFGDVPPSEVRAFMMELLRREPFLADANDEALLFRRVLHAYGAQRLTLKARQVLERAVALSNDDATTPGRAEPPAPSLFDAPLAEEPTA
ncbi:AAA domain-containing protein [Deinococcus yavapaiensis]|uniref:AAA domain-containing protein n=1 Tax=Deinococcus yavapaiensis KR-236 TaxID=694435 RepID=A0A318S882_9DEIO|nr:AAA domain-containing protein [Deinococcus yavapaiensis]PYE51991.1 AAA domain-containing protein [Deinococcus yavapaiensis KR-236]